MRFFEAFDHPFFLIQGIKLLSFKFFVGFQKLIGLCSWPIAAVSDSVADCHLCISKLQDHLEPVESTVMDKCVLDRRIVVYNMVDLFSCIGSCLYTFSSYIFASFFVRMWKSTFLCMTHVPCDSFDSACSPCTWNFVYIFYSIGGRTHTLVHIFYKRVSINVSDGYDDIQYAGYMQLSMEFASK